MKQKEQLQKIYEGVSDIKTDTKVLREKIDTQAREMLEHKIDDKDYKKKQDIWQAKIEDSLTHCPKEEQINTHSKDIKEISITVKAVRLLLAGILVAGAAFGIWFGFMGISKGAPLNPDEVPYVYESQEDKNVMLEIIINRLNKGHGAKTMGVYFRGTDLTVEKPTLQMTTLNHCLMCQNCEQYTRNILINIQTIAFGWFKWSGSQHMEIYNKDGRLILIMDEDGKLSVAKSIKMLVQVN